MNVATSCEQNLDLGANVIYNPYNANMMNNGWQGHPDSMNQPEPQNYDPRPMHGYPQTPWGMPVQNPYGEAMPYAMQKPYEEECEEEAVAKKQATAMIEKKHKKTTFEATIEPKIKHKEYYPMKEELIYVEEKPVKHEHEKYVSEKEYYTDHQMPHHKKKYAMETEGAGVQGKLTCENLPLATTYVRSQPYQNLNSPAETLRQGTLFNDLYRPYVPRKVAQGGRR